jgi:hypothetical protein
MDGDREVQTTEVRNDTNTVPAEPATQRQTVVTDRRVGSGVIAARVIYWLTGAIIALLALRVVLLLLAANPSSPFVNFVYSLSGIFAWPFYGIFGYQPSYGSSTLELSSIVAIIVYALVGMGLAKLFTLGSNRTDA